MSVIKLYSVKILEEKNFVVEDIETYLGSLPLISKISFNNAQYIKQGLNVEAKVVLSQDFLDKKITRNFNYASIENENGENYYYFIKDKKWTSKNSIKLVLKLDVLNTFNGRYKLTNKTNILRQHKDRWEFEETLPERITSSKPAKYLQAKVDETNEDFGELSKILKSNNVIYEDENNHNHKWYLVYKTPNEPTLSSPVKCYLVPNFQYRIGYGGTNTVTLQKEWFTKGYSYYITNIDNIASGVSMSWENDTRYLDEDFKTQGRYIAFCVHRNDNPEGKLVISAIQYGNNNRDTTNIIVDSNATHSNIDYVRFTNAYYIRRNDGEVADIFDTNLDKIQSGYYKTIIAGATFGDIYSQTIDDIPKTDPKLMKIIELPYCPINLNDTSLYTIDTRERLIEIDYKSELLNNFKTINLANYVNLNQLANYSEEVYEAQRFLKDSKLLHSNITELKIVYDNFYKVLSFENCRLNSYSILPTTPKQYKMSLYYKQANNITSSLAFKFVPLDFNEKGEFDYYEYIISTRNNEIPLFSNAYLDYMRTDYNYAKKSQQLNSINSIFNTATATIGAAIAGGMSGGTTGAIIGGATAAIKGIESGIVQQIQSSNNIEQTIANKKNAATGVQGSDNLNLFNYYSENRISLKVYQPKDYILEKIDDLFYYYGYKCFEQNIPNINSRLWFNYLKCEPDFEETFATSKINDECKKELITKFNEGATFLHKVSVSGVNVWDFEQQMENWEVDLL